MNSNTIRNYIKNPWSIAISLARRGWLNGLPDKAYLSLMYRARFGKKLNWDNPSTFSEKLQKIKLIDRKPAYTIMSDKFAAKDYVAECIGKEYVVPVLGGPWYSAEDIDFDALPDQFVLKTNHDCGGVWVCRSKNELDITKVRAFLTEHLNRKYYLHCREWPYKDIKPCIFAEAYLEDKSSGRLRDYKVMTFNGEPRLIYITSGRDYKNENDVVYADFFDTDFNHVDLCIDHENAPVAPLPPKQFKKMIEFSRALAQNTKHLRVDFYEVNGKLYTGELTFFHCGGLKPFITDEWDGILGSWIDLH